MTEIKKTHTSVNRSGSPINRAGFSVVVFLTLAGTEYFTGRVGLKKTGFFGRENSAHDRPSGLSFRVGPGLGRPPAYFIV
jgi:hypothetical protein